MYPIEGTHDHDTNNLKLYPGVPARRKRSSGCKHFLIIILATIALIAALFIGRSIVSIFNDIREPHASLLYKGNSLDLVDPASVIRPLIDENQTFDIVATVWLRTNDSRSGHDVIWQRLDGIKGTVSTLPRERAIFTETVFKGLKLKDKEIHTTVKYKVPTEIFKNRDLNHYDLRASFVLVPTSPSLLDNLVNYSSWRNDKILFPPFRSWSNTGRVPTLQDEAIDSFGASIGLLTFSGIQSRCATAAAVGTSNTISVSDHSLFEDNADDDDSDNEIDVNIANGKHTKPSKSGRSRSPITYPPESSKGKPVLESHPYIISRSFILAADRTKLYDRKAYNKAHTVLMASACGLALSPPTYDWKLCNEQFDKHGNMDTRLQLKMAEERIGNKIRKHWAYAPYLTLAKSTWTPKDLVPVPVNREDCTKGGRFNGSEPLLPNEEYVDITWEIVYSGRSPTQLKISEAIRAAPFYNMTDTEANQQAAQVGWETIHVLEGLRGHRLSEDRHPRRIILVDTLLTTIRFVTTLLDLHYWYTRSSTVGISKFAVTLGAAIRLGEHLLIAFFQDYRYLSNIVMIIVILPFQMAPFLMLKVVWRIRIGWGQNKGKGNCTEEPKRWGRIRLPSLYFAKATHRERASDSLDRLIPWILKLALFISCCLTYLFFSPSTSYLIPPLGLPVPQDEKFWLRDTLLRRSIFSPGIIVWSILQLWFNRQSHTFSGKYKVTAALRGVRTALGMLKFSTQVLGIRDVREGFSVHDLMCAIVVVVWCWQAMMLPKVSQVEIDDEVE